MSTSLSRWNEADVETAMNAMTACCGAHRWAAAVVGQRPIAGDQELHAIADQLWDAMEVPDWLEAFACHPRIGEPQSPRSLSPSSAWSTEEQSSMQTAADATRALLAQGNARYEQVFGFTYIVCATGKGPEEMLSILNRRLTSDRASELREAAEQQRQIMHIRLRKWLEQ